MVAKSRDMLCHHEGWFCGDPYFILGKSGDRITKKNMYMIANTLLLHLGLKIVTFRVDQIVTFRVKKLLHLG